MKKNSSIKMDIRSADEEPSSSIFKLFTPETASKENGNIKKTTEVCFSKHI